MTAETIARARILRKKLTLPEGLLWRELRRRPGGLKFRRQHPLGPFVLDFYCREAAVAVEVGGAAHDMGDNPQRDVRRDQWLAEQGVLTLRIPAADLFGDLEGVLRFVVESCAVRAPPPRSARSPSPRNRGEES